MTLLDDTLTFSVNKGYIDSAEAARTKQVIVNLFSKYGMSPDWMALTVLMEVEGFNPKDISGRCYGVVQVCQGESGVDTGGGIAAIGGFDAFLNAGTAKQIELWGQYQLDPYLKHSKRPPISAAELYLINLFPECFRKLVNGTANVNTYVRTTGCCLGTQAKYLYNDYNPVTNSSRRLNNLGDSDITPASIEKGLLYKAAEVLNGNPNTPIGTVANALSTVGTLLTNPTALIASGLNTLSGAFNSAIFTNQICNPPDYTQQARIIYPGCLTKAASPITSNSLGSGATAPGVTSLQPAATTSNPTLPTNAETQLTNLKPGALISPAKGHVGIASGFGMRWGKMHKGVDLAVPYGTPLYASGDGEVTEIENGCAAQGYYGNPCGGKYGNHIYIQIGNIELRYAHLSAVYVTKGPVKQGQLVGASGNSGSSTGPHCHFEVRPNGTPQDPTQFIKF